MSADQPPAKVFYPWEAVKVLGPFGWGLFLSAQIETGQPGWHIAATIAIVAGLTLVPAFGLDGKPR